MSAQYRRKDRFYHRAKNEGFAARSVYKLEEIDQRYSLLSRGARVVDLGCAPGSWMQYAAGVVGPKGLVIGYDLAPPQVALPPHARCFVADVFEIDAARVRSDAGDDKPFDALLSDMAPKTTGIRDADQAKQIGLVEHALHLAIALLGDGGYFAAKVFQGRGFDELLNVMKRELSQVRALRPKATRQGSREAFLIARKTG